MGASRYRKLHRNRRRERAYRHRPQGGCRLFHTGRAGGDLLPPAERHGAHPARVGRLAARLRRRDADRGAFVPKHRLRVQYLGCSDCARRRAGRSGRRSAAHRAGQDRRLLCGPTREQCTRPFGQGQFHLAVLISTLPPRSETNSRSSNLEPEGSSKMKLPRRNFLHLAAGAAALPAVSRIAFAQAYPTRPVRIIVGFAPAGGTDIMARLIAQWLSERLGQQFVIENRPGAGTNIGTEAAVRAPADGYTLLLVTSVNAINATLYDKLNFNFIRDIAPVAGISRESHVMVVNPLVPTKTVPEFIAYAKAN